jgi:hypothetical protein
LHDRELGQEVADASTRYATAFDQDYVNDDDLEFVLNQVKQTSLEELYSASKSQVINRTVSEHDNQINSHEGKYYLRSLI